MSHNLTGQQNGNLRVPTNAFERHTLVERFEQIPILNADVLITTTAETQAQATLRFRANRLFEVKGTNMTSVLCTHSPGGGITMTTAGADADQGILIPHADALQTSWATTDWSTDDEVAFGSKIKFGASIADIDIWTGLMLTSPATFDIADDDDKALFYYGDAVANSNSNIELLYSVGGTDYQIDTGVLAVASQAYAFEIAINSDRIIKAYINGDLVHEAANALTTAIDLIPTTGVEANATAAKAITVRNPYVISKTQND